LGLLLISAGNLQHGSGPGLSIAGEVWGTRVGAAQPGDCGNGGPYHVRLGSVLALVHLEEPKIFRQDCFHAAGGCHQSVNEEHQWWSISGATDSVLWYSCWG